MLDCCEGRAGYGSTLDGMVGQFFIKREVKEVSHVILQWPYSYDSCDVGTLPNQTYPGRGEPLAATQGGDPGYDGVLVCSTPCFPKLR